MDQPDSNKRPAVTAAMPWRGTLVALVAMLALIMLAYHETLASMVRVWISSRTYNHGFLIAPISLYLVWEKRRALAEMSPEPFLKGLWALPLLGVIWLLGNIAEVQLVQHFALVLILQVAIISLVGWRIGCFLAFPIAYLLFAVPVGDFLIPHLQDLTAQFIVVVLRIIGIPVFHDGVFISIPSGNFEVAEACAGVRFLIATIALGALFSHLSFSGWRRNSAFMALCVVVPIVANGIRALGIVLIAYYSNNKYAVGVDHIVYGWGFFAVITLVLLWVGSRFANRDPFSPDHDAVAADCAVPSVVPGNQGPVVRASLAVVVLATMAPALAGWLDGGGTDAVNPGAVPELAAPGWQVASDQSNWKPVFPGAGLTWQGRFARGQARLDAFVGYYPRQRQGAEVIGSVNRITGERPWQRASGGSHLFRINSADIRGRYERMISGRGNRVAVYWYFIDGVVTTDARVAKLLHLRSVIGGRGGQAAVLILSTEYPDQLSEGFAGIQAFLDRAGDIKAMLSRFVRQAGGNKQE